MKTDVIAVSSKGNEIEEALLLADKVAAYKNLSPKSALHLRLLTEEAMGMLRSITGQMDGTFWIEDNDGLYELHLQVYTLMDEKKREQLLAASSSGVNEATRGIMGRIRAFFEPPMDGTPMFSSAPMAGMSPQMHGNMVWSMEDYRAQLSMYRAQSREGAAEAWDELEKSVVSHVADDVKVSIRGRDVEMIIYKKMA